MLRERLNSLSLTFLETVMLKEAIHDFAKQKCRKVRYLLYQYVCIHLSMFPLACNFSNLKITVITRMLFIPVEGIAQIYDQDFC